MDSLAELSLEELSNVQVTSVSKSSELLKQAPASIYVITHDEILRAGVTTVADALRLAPNLQITQFSSNRYIAGARGLGGSEEAQNFSNKLLILIDGRSVYTPLYSGVYLDVQDLVMDDIDRIEVISGPGATLWGANAMHGVINIITRPAYLTDESVVKTTYGNQERGISTRYGSRHDELISYRIYAKAFEHDEFELANGAGAQDDWNKVQIGMRMDWTRGDDTVTTQGDLYRGTVDQPGQGKGDVSGGNLLSRWQRRTEYGDWQVQGYFDQTQRAAPVGGVAFMLHTYDVELQHHKQFGRHGLIWGAGVRTHSYTITNSAGLSFEPDEGRLTLGNVFAQDTYSLSNSVDVSVGLKAEHDPYSGWNWMPDVRASWRPNDHSVLWGAGSRAIRAPTPFDHDVVERVGTTVFLTGNDLFVPERVDAFELGYRVQALQNLSISVSTFYNVYHDLRTIEPYSNTQFLPIKWDNQMEGSTYGAELWAKWQVTDWWRLAPGGRWLKKHLEFSPSASGIVGLWQSGNDPEYQVLLTSSMDFGTKVSFDVSTRYVDALPEPHLDAYYEVNASLNWQALRRLDITLTGLNLLEPRHVEYPVPSGEYVRRSIFLQARWKF